MFKVAFVGHSQVPQDLEEELSGVEIRTFRVPGARADNFDQDSRLTPVLDWKHDFSVLWLGSNDIDDDTNPSWLAETILDVAENIQESCESEVVIVEMENRTFTDRDNITAEEYRKIKRSVNRKLQKDKRFLSINFGGTMFTLDSDGVHFEASAQELIEQKLLQNIIDAKARWEQGSSSE